MMDRILNQSESIILRYTETRDLDFVLNAERKEENAQYVGQWTKEQHINSLSNKDILHIIVEDASSHNPVGYLILAGIENINRNIEFRRIVICEKSKGYGKETLKLIKELSFEKLKAHRLWLDVRLKNKKAQRLYKSQGFKEEGILRECVIYKNEYESLIMMSILEQEYFKI